MAYAQKDYSEKLGNSEYSIAQAGSLITAFSNLLSRYGVDISPKDLNSSMVASGIDVAQGISWGYVSCFEPSVAVLAAGEGAPSVDESIVELKQTNPATGEVISTYCAVVSAAEGIIIDSFDGLEKSWNVYGGPVSYVAFTQYPLILIAPLVAPEETVAADTMLETDFIAPPKNKFEWQNSYVTGLGAVEAVFVAETDVYDLSGVKPPVHVETDTQTLIAGKFVKDGELYFRTKTSVENGDWYGIPRISVRRMQDLVEEEKAIDDYLESVAHMPEYEETVTGLSIRDKAVKTGATLEGKVKGFFGRKG